MVELCRRLLAKNPKILADTNEGKTKGAGALIGQAKKVNPTISRARLLEICLEPALAM